jgi:hypothetical protein
MRPIIGITGLIGSGKGTIATALVNNHSYTKMSFADAVKDACAVIFGWDRKMIEGDTPESREWRTQVDEFWSDRLGIPDFTPRMAMQLLGTEAGRGVFGEEIWVSTVEKRILSMTEGHGVVIPDVRFPNEIQCIKKMHGIIVQVRRGDLPEHWDLTVLYNRSQAGLIPKNPTIEAHGKWLDENIHASEREWIGMDIPDYVVFNDAGIERLEYAAKMLIDELDKK